MHICPRVQVLANHIDRILVLNCDNFSNLIMTLYGSNLVVESTGSGNLVNFLDLSIEILQGSLSLNVYNMADSFDFSPNKVRS